MHLFYAPELTDEPVFTLNPDESHHAVRVLRLGTGSPVVLVNGRGGWYEARILDTDPKRCTVEITALTQGVGKPLYDLHIALAPTKQIDRFEWFVEKATEIGISRITPLICEHSERKDVKIDRTLRIVLAAMKQSLTAFHPVIGEPLSFRAFMQQPRAGVQLIAHCQPGPKEWLDAVVAPGLPVTILVGPEGDFSDTEIALALANNYRPITLGSGRLRTETAGVVACHSVSWIFRST